MRTDTLEILRCPYCGGRLELVESMPHRLDAGEILDGVLGCHCCIFPVVAGIPVMHLLPESVQAREAVEAGDFDAAFRALIAPEDEETSARFQELTRRPDVTYRELVDALGGGFEGGYFLYRFSDPSYVVASAVVGAVAGTIMSQGGRAVDICGGSGHLTRTLLGLSSEPPVIADLFFAKLWLAARYVAAGCEPVCCDGNAPLPFARGAFSYAMCADAFMFIWTKRQLVTEMLRLIDRPGPGAAVITHAHNQLVWSPSHGNPLPPEGYRDLFETLRPRVYAEAALLDDMVGGGPLDLSRQDDAATLEADAALTIVASRDLAVFRAHAIVSDPAIRGRLRLNPLYAAERDSGGLSLRLSFPSEDYEDEYGACRRYLPEDLTLDRATLDEVAAGTRSPRVVELLRRRVVLDVPHRYC
ncbi:MAG: hypothetical protein EXR95_00425 [Gemmatimonadetes bacterium]|nr:hypothetical protein [Gemmatimonadota bacterium]